MVVTSTDVTTQQSPVYEVFHDYDEEEGDIWQFHGTAAALATSAIQLVTFEQILRLAPELLALPHIPRGFYARRTDRASSWIVEKQPSSST
jgi:hypothetical protein